METLRFLQGVAIVVIFSGSAATACKVAPLNSDKLLLNADRALVEHVKSRFAGLEPSSLRFGADRFSRPITRFPRPIGPDCSGLEAAYSESAFLIDYDREFLNPSRNSHCVAVGRVVIHGYREDGPATITMYDNQCEKRTEEKNR